MKRYYIKIIQARLRRHFLRNFQRLDPAKFKPGEGLFNSQCYYNSVQCVKQDRAMKVFLVYHIDLLDDFGALHVINGLECGMYQDNSLGFLYETSSYFLITEILPDNYYNVGSVFEGFRSDFGRMFSSKFLIWLLRIKPIDIF